MRRDVKIGWWLPAIGELGIALGRPRQVLAARNGYVLYSTTVSQRECQERTFKRWIRTTRATQPDPTEAPDALG